MKIGLYESNFNLVTLVKNIQNYSTKNKDFDLNLNEI